MTILCSSLCRHFTLTHSRRSLPPHPFSTHMPARMPPQVVSVAKHPFGPNSAWVPDVFKNQKSLLFTPSATKETKPVQEFAGVVTLLCKNVVGDNCPLENTPTLHTINGTVYLWYVSGRSPSFCLLPPSPIPIAVCTFHTCRIAGCSTWSCRSHNC